MNNKLTKGMIIKNYKELCEIMGWKTTRGNYMKARLKDLETLCDFHKEGNKFIIDEVFEEPKEKLDNRANNGTNSIFADDIEKLIIDMCSVAQIENYDNIQLSLNGLLLALNIINNNYNVGSYNQKRLSQYLQIPIETINDFYSSTYSKNKMLLERQLDKMQNKCLIFWQRSIRINTKDGTVREATDKEKQQIVDAEQKVLEEMGYESKKDLFLSGNWIKFSEKVRKLLIERRIAIDYYKVYKIIPSTKFVQMVLEQREKNQIQNNLNKNVIDSAIKSANKRHDKAKEHKEEVLGKLKNDKENNRATNNYVINTVELAKLVLSTDTNIRLAEVINLYKDEAYIN